MSDNVPKSKAISVSHNTSWDWGALVKQTQAAPRKRVSVITWQTAGCFYRDMKPGPCVWNRKLASSDFFLSLLADLVDWKC